MPHLLHSQRIFSSNTSSCMMSIFLQRYDSAAITAYTPQSETVAVTTYSAFVAARMPCLQPHAHPEPAYGMYLAMCSPSVPIPISYSDRRRDSIHGPGIVEYRFGRHDRGRTKN